MSTKSLGFVGLGIMGNHMAANLAKAGFDVTVWNRSPDKCDSVAALGAKVASSPRAVAEACDITFGMLSDPAAVLGVVEGPDGVAAGLSKDKGYVDCSTVDAGTSQRVAELVHAAGALFLEGPVSGSKKPAEDGALILLCAGDRELYDDPAVTRALEVMGKARFYHGEVGAGARMKLVVNLIMGNMMCAFCEGIALAEHSELDAGELLEVLSLGVMANKMFEGKGASIVEDKYPPAFPLKHQQKDLRLALELAHERGVELPVTAAANAQYVKASAMGHGDADFSAVAKAARGGGKAE